jgi:hypothetical protein
MNLPARPPAYDDETGALTDKTAESQVREKAADKTIN